MNRRLLGFALVNTERRLAHFSHPDDKKDEDFAQLGVVLYCEFLTSSFSGDAFSVLTGINGGRRELRDVPFGAVEAVVKVRHWWQLKLSLFSSSTDNIAILSSSKRSIC